MKRAAIALLQAGLLVGCLPVQERVRNHDVLLKRFTHRGDREAPELQAKVDSSAGMLSLVLESVVTCTEEQRHSVRRMRELDRRTNPWLHGSFYLLGLAGTGLGGFVLYDNLSVDVPQDRAFPVGNSIEQGQNVGIAISAIGGALLLIAFGSSASAADQRSPAVTVELPVKGTKRKAECERSPATSEHVGLVFVTTDAQRVYLSLGRTDGSGTITTSWSTIQAQLQASVRPEANVVVGAPDEVAALLARNKAITVLATVISPAVQDPEQAWASAVALDTEAAYRGFIETHPDSPRLPEAVERARRVKLREANRQFEIAVAEANLDKATEALATLRTIADPGAIGATQERYDRLKLVIRAKEFQARFPKLLSTLERADEAPRVLVTITEGMEALRAVDIEATARVETQLATARDQLTERFVRDGREAAKRRDFTASTKQFAAAAAVARDAAAVEKARAAAVAEAVKVGHAEARGLARQDGLEAAIAIADALLAVAPKARGLAADRTRWQATAARAEQSAAARAAREEAEQRRKVEREAAAQAAREEREAAAQAARVAREAAVQAAREAREARESSARAARDAAAQQARAKREQEAAQRVAREQAARDAAEQRRRQQEDERARARAAEAAQLEQQRRAARMRKEKEEEERRLAAAAKLDAQLARKQQPAPPVTVQFELPTRYAADDVLKRLPVPKSCTATIKTFFAKPTTCASCAPRAMSRVEMTCGALGFSFLRDQRHVWLTCKGDPQACGDCLAAGESALAPFLSGRERLRVVQGCPKR